VTALRAGRLRLISVAPHFLTAENIVNFLALQFHLLFDRFCYRMHVRTRETEEAIAGCFGVFALLNAEEDNEHMKWFTIMSVFNTFVVWGKMSVLGYEPSPLIDQVPHGWSGCNDYYTNNQSSAQCDGYVNWLQFLTHSIILAQPLQAFFVYLIWKGKGANSELKVPGRYDSIGETRVGDSS